MTGKHRFAALDAMRGVAAIVVVWFHLGVALHGRHNIGNAGYLAVDFFFMLSGFVLSLAYQRRLDAGISTLALLKIRLIRLYPIYALGLAVGVAVELNSIGQGRHSLASAWFWITLLLNSLLLPSLAHAAVASSPIFPFNFPSWSLLYEILANIFHFILLRRRRVSFVLCVTALAGAVTVLGVYRYGSLTFGPGAGQFFYILGRVIFSYTVGALLFRLWQQMRFRLRLPLTVQFASLLLVMMLPMQEHVALHDLLVVAGLFPVLILAGAEVQLSGRSLATARMLGDSSYAVYLLHMPLWTMISSSYLPLWGSRFSHTQLPRVVFPLLLTGVALLVDRWYDTPVRRYLHSRWSEIFWSSKPVVQG